MLVTFCQSKLKSKSCCSGTGLESLEEALEALEGLDEPEKMLEQQLGPW